MIQALLPLLAKAAPFIKAVGPLLKQKKSGGLLNMDQQQPAALPVPAMPNIQPTTVGDIPPIQLELLRRRSNLGFGMPPQRPYYGGY